MRFLVYLSVLILPAFVIANETQFGVILGSTTGISAKFDLKADRAIDAALSYSSDNKFGFSLHGDYLINKARQYTLGQLKPVNLYYGIGFRVQNIRSGADNGKSRLGVRAPIGVNYQISNPDIEFFGELAPILDITPSTEVSFEVGLGVRYRF